MNPRALLSACRPGRCSRDALTVEVGVARSRLVNHLCGQLGDDGALRGRCSSRILESGLLLTLLRAVDRHAAVRARLEKYLSTASPATPLDRAVADAALHGSSSGLEHRVQDYLNGFQHFTGKRKHVLLSTVLAVLGLGPLGADRRAAQLTYGQYATWTNLSLCAIQILQSPYGGQTSAVSTDAAYLVKRLSEPRCQDVWEGNLLAHLLALHALQLVDPGGRLLCEQLDIVVGVVNPDGGVPFVVGQEIFLTANAGLALLAAGAATPARLVDKIAAYLASHQQPDGGWGYIEGIEQTDADDTAWCSLLLRSVDPRCYGPQVRQAERYLTGLARADGGFSTYVPTEPSEPQITAEAVLALTPVHQRHRQVLNAAAGFLLDAQCADGSFETSWTRSESSVINLVLAAFQGLPPILRARHAEAIAQASKRAVARLEETQNDDGGWGHGPSSDPLSTAQALSALATATTGHAWCRGAEYLLSVQRADGGFTSSPDQVGPRPFPFEFTAIADIAALQAFNSTRDLVRGKKGASLA